jgi:hypothetical protein
MLIQDNYSDAVGRFGLVSRRYCSLVDSRATLDKAEFLHQIYGILTELIVEAIRLPQVHFTDDENERQAAKIREACAKSRMKHEGWSTLYNSLQEKLGDWDLYWQVFDPTKDNEAIRGSLADDIADIYRDVKDGIRLTETNQAPFDVIIFDWRFGFSSHWGNHAMNALRTIHFLLDDDSSPD